MKTILLVDDEYFFRQSLKKITPWAEYGFSVIGEANNGADALKLVCEKQPDVVFLDINMPVLNGMQFCEELQKRELFPKIVILSGYEEFEYVKQALRYGVRDYLLKPIDFEEMKQTLQTLQLELMSKRPGADDTKGLEADEPAALLALLDEEYHPKDACRAPLMPLRSDKIKRFVQENLAKPEMNVDFISKAFFISYHYLCVMFKKEAGITLNEYITNERMQKAKYLFDTGAVSVSLAACSVGFQDPNYFSRAFKKYTGVSPSAYIISKGASGSKMV